MQRHTIRRIYAVRGLVDLLLRRVVGHTSTPAFIQRVLRTRYDAIVDVFPARSEDEAMCRDLRVDHNVLGRSKLDVGVLASLFLSIKPSSVRDILLTEFIEEVVTQTIGVDRLYAFFRYCFVSHQTYQLFEKNVKGKLY
jgi:hypothetical protein